MSFKPIPIRLAAGARRPWQPSASHSQEEHVAAPSEANLSLVGDAGDDSPAFPSVETEDAEEVATQSPDHVRLEAAAAAATVGAPSSNHQFWLKEAKIAEDLFTIHRSAKHLAEFTSAIIGNHDPSLGHRPIPVMSDGDVLFMTQLSNDIARSVGGISAVRHHGLRTKKRKSRTNGAGSHSKREDKADTRGGASKRIQVKKAEEDTVSCSKCGRTETPEWRKGPDGLLCNVCGLVYAKQRRKLKSG